MNRRAALLAMLGVAGCAAAPATPPVEPPARPIRVMSLNQCTDQLVLALLPRERIASVTWLARDPRYSAHAAEAQRVAVNRGSAEEVLRQRPDLIVTDSFSNPGGRAMLRRLGYPLIELGDASDVDGITANVRRLASAMGERARGETMIATMRADLAPPSRPLIRAAVWGRDGMGGGPLLDLALRAAGIAQVGGSGGTDLETLLAADPPYLVTADESGGGATLGDAKRRHPLVERRWPGDRRFTVAPASLICGTPDIAKAARQLKAQLAARKIT